MRRWLSLSLILLGLAYLAYPYVTAWRIDRAVTARDTTTLESLIDWPLLRERLKADVKQALVEAARDHPDNEEAEAVIGAALAALLVPTVIDSAVDEIVTPENLAANIATQELAAEGHSPLSLVRYAFFDSPTVFRVDLRDPGSPDAPGLTVLMELQADGVWRVTTVKLPADLISELTHGPQGLGPAAQ
jgi:hypothetical protein